MVREKIPFLFLLLLIHVNAVEIYNDGQSSESSWFKNWRKSVTKHPADSNQITLSSSTPALPKYLEPSSTVAPVHLEIKKINSYTIAPEIIEGRSVRPSPASTTEEAVVEIKPRRVFNFREQEVSHVATEAPKTSPTIISWVPETIVESKSSSLASPAIIKTEKPLHKIHRFEFGLIQPSYSETHNLNASPSVSWVPEIVKSEPPIITTVSHKPKFDIKSFDHNASGSTLNSETELKASTSRSSISPETSVESKPLTTSAIPPTIVKLEEPTIQINPKHRIFNFGSIPTHNTESELPKKSSNTITWTTPEPRPLQLVAISEVPSSTKNYTPIPKLSSTLIIPKYGLNATELEMTTQPAPIEKSPGFIVYRYEEPVKSTGLTTQEGIENYFSNLQHKYKCNVENGYYEVVNHCDKFVQCKDNVLKLFKCSNGLHFKRNTVWPSDPCDEPSKAKCENNGIEIEVKPEIRIIPTKFSAVLITNSIDFICPSENGYYRLEKNCEKFIKCEKKVPSSYACASGLTFNSNAAWDHDPCSADVLCKTVVVRPEPELKFSATFLSALPTFSCPASEGYFISENHCDKFIKCEKSIASLYKCASGLQFNRYASWIHDPCEKESEVGCKAVAVAEGQLLRISASLILARIDGYSCPAANGYHRFENDCEMFVKCENSIASSYKCNPGLQFNSYALWGVDPCVNSEIVRCKTVIIHPPLIPKLSADFITRTYNFSCPASEGYYGIDTDCDLFYLCDKSIASVYKCSTGRQFNRYATWGQDPCADEKMIRCSTLVIEQRPEPKFSADLIVRQIADYECTSSEGYFRLDKECDKFIKCEKSIASSYKCWSGLQFNSEAAWGEDPCASVDIIDCKAAVLQPTTDPAPKFSATVVKLLLDFSCPSNNGYFDSKNECEEFVKCENAVASLYKCLPGLQFNRHSSWGEDPCASDTTVRCKPVVVEPQSAPPPKFSATLISRIVFDFTCPINNGYFESKNECEKFIKCENAVASLYRCLPGFQFKSRSSWGEDPCASEELIQCKPVVIPLPRPQFSADLILSYMLDFKCTTSNGYFKFGDDCVKFVKCENSKASSYKCWSGLHFNPQAPWGQDPCASASEVGCRPVILPPITTPAPRFSAILISSPLVDYKCLESNGYFGIDNDCDRFIKCEMLMPSLYMCPKGLQFNRRARFGEDPCASTSIAQCESRTTTTTTPATILSYTLIMRQVFGYTCAAANGYYSVKNQCGQFIECKNYIPSLYKCNSGLYFNRNVMWGADPCALPSVAHCEQTPKSPPGPIEHHDSFQCPERDGMYPLDNFECSKYLMCKMGRATIMPCPAGLVFNDELQTCDWPVNVPSCNPELFHGFSCPAPESDEYNTPSDKIIKFKFEQSCTHYIACQHGHPRLLSCNKGLVFSEEYQACLIQDMVPSCRG
ncbi:uncharacterized protein LOC128670255 [Plodia interpunctella]|uniref:uncharacterized protein LOC128670255 n=1 Tax=Plodia interpunctella TaxID=58824 RepID=UPI0023684CE3|nr:uncharacterized protein LOC128670255 [Plodia interpunctella]